MTQTVFLKMLPYLKELNLQVPLDTQVLVFDGTRLSLKIFTIQVLSLGTEYTIFPENKQLS